MIGLDGVLLLLVLAVMVALFLTEKLPYDLTALLGAGTLLAAGIITPEELYSGVSSPAVVMIFSTFIVASACRRTGVADWCAWRIAPWIGSSELKAAIVTVLAVILVSAFMHNVAATALLLPAATSLCRLAKVPTSKVLMPLSFGAMFGGMTTLIGATPHLVASELLMRSGYTPFHVFDFTIIGGVCSLLGAAYMVTLGRKLLPRGNVALLPSEQLSSLYQLDERLLAVEVPIGSSLAGKSLQELDLNALLNVEVLAVERRGVRRLAPEPDFQIAAGDILHVRSRLGPLLTVLSLRGWSVRGATRGEVKTATGGKIVMGWSLPATSCSVSFPQSACTEVGFSPLALVMNGVVSPTSSDPISIPAGAVLFGLGQSSASQADMQQFFESRGLSENIDPTQGTLFWLEAPSDWEGEESIRAELPRRARFAVVGFEGVEQDGFKITSSPAALPPSSRCLVLAHPLKFPALLMLMDLAVTSSASKLPLENRAVCLMEVLIPPRSQLVGRTIPELEFRRRFGFQVVALWKGGRPHRTYIANAPLEVGDALLLQGLRKHMKRILSDSTNFLVLSELPQRKARSAKRPHVVAGFLVMLLLMISGWQAPSAAALLAALWMVACGAVKTREAYEEVEWSVIFLVASILPFGQALIKTGLAESGASLVLKALQIAGVGHGGHYLVLLGLVVVSSLIAQTLDGALSVVLLSPVALSLSTSLNVSIYPLMMVIALGASIAFETPVSHKAHLLVMAPGGYRLSDFVRVGTPLSILLVLVVVVLTPLFFPF